MIQKVFNANEMIFRQGEPGEEMYDILSGSVGIYLNYGLPEQKLLARVEANACFGEMAIIEKAPRSATAVALEDSTQLAAITGADFSAYFETRPEKVLDIMQQLSKRLRALTEDYLDACKTVTEAANTMEDGRTCDPELAERVRLYAQQAGA